MTLTDALLISCLCIFVGVTYASIPSCGRREFACPVEGLCIRIDQRCDGRVDCSDAIDEANCGKVDRSCISNNTRIFWCSDKSQCVNLTSVCDGVRDCTDGSDESPNCNQSSCTGFKCNQYCRTTPGGIVCYCDDGHELMKDGKTCKDINECQNEPCNQLCTNTKGSFQCKCTESFVLDNDGISCRAVGPEAFIVYAASDELHGRFINHLMDDDSFILNDVGMISFVAYDGIDSRLYWSDVTRHQIVSSNFDGSDRKLVANYGIEQPEGIEVDWIARNLYFVDAALQHIVVCKLGRGMCAVVVSSDLEKPRGLALDPLQRLMFWSDWGDQPKIESAFMDGSGRRLLVNDHIIWPNGLVSDHVRQIVYWVDSKLDTVSCVQYSGAGRKELLKHEIHHPFSVTLFEDSILWTDVSSLNIASVNRFTGKNLTTVITVTQFATALSVIHPALQPIRPNPCLYHPCSHVCALGATGAVCKCPVGFRLHSDAKTCIDTIRSDYLVVANSHNLWKVYPQSIGIRPERLLLNTGLDNIIALMYDWSSRSLFYADSNHQVVRSWLNDTEGISQVIHGSGVDCLAVDWLAKNLYSTNSVRGEIAVSRLDGTSRRVLIQNKLFKPRAIVLDPSKGLLFFSDVGAHSRIEKCAMDATMCYTLVNELGWPNAMVLDIQDDQLYWVDSKFDTVETVHTSGKGRKVLTSRNIEHSFGIALLGDILFFTDLFKSMMYVNKTGGHQRSILSGQTGLTSVIGVSPQLQTGTNACSVNNGGCSDLCLGTQDGKFVCQCPTAFQIGEDGLTCVVNCAKNSFMCDNKSKCIGFLKLCDGQNDCADGSDEVADICMKTVTCSLYDFTCSSKKCISKSYVCDGDDDCGDGSDEDNCEGVTCRVDHYQCPGGQCVQMSNMCDGTIDCPDGSDEANCSTLSCVNKFDCGNGQCVPMLWFCDGQVDCTSGRDEPTNCTESCDDSEWRCADRKCIFKTYRCDGEPDCGDESDEKDCPPVSVSCSGDLFMCSPTGPCIDVRLKCDGDYDCPDGEDESEALCGRTAVICSEGEFRCNDQKCVPKNWVCDGMDDCPDGRDERQPECLPTSRSPSVRVQDVGDCGVNMYRCSGGECILNSFLCNNVSDCSDGTDEGGACSVSCSSRNGGCSHDCTSSPRGPLCSCPHGYRLLNDDRTCQDIDECELPDSVCSQICINTKGSYICVCRSGYQLSGRSGTCKVMGTEAEIIFSNYKEIRSMTTHGTHYRTLLDHIHGRFVAVDFHWVGKSVYFSDVMQRGVWKYSLESRKLIDVPVLKGREVNGLAVDWTGNNMYLAQASPSSISVCAIGRWMCAKLIRRGLDHPRAIAVYPSAGFLFWSDWGIEPKIERAWMDGSRRVTIIHEKISWPNGLVVDVASNLLYWVDAKLDTLECADLDGNNRVKLSTKHVYHPFSIAVFEDNVFWTDWALGSILKADKRSAKNMSLVMGHLQRPMDLKIIHPALQPSSTNHCRTMDPPCTHLCLLTPEGATCTCPTGYVLDDKVRKCKMSDIKSVLKPVLDVVAFNKSLGFDHIFKKQKLFCDQNICHNGGVCYRLLKGEVCDCPVNYTGLLCEVAPPIVPRQIITSDGGGMNPHVIGITVGCLLLVFLGVMTAVYCCRYNGQRYGFLRQVARFHRASKGTDTDDVERLVFETYHAGQAITESPPLSPAAKSPGTSSSLNTESTASQTDLTTDPDISTDSSYECPHDFERLLPDVRIAKKTNKPLTNCLKRAV